MLSPERLTMSCTPAASRSLRWAAAEPGTGLVVTTCQVVASGSVSGSVVAMTARSVFSDPYGPACTSRAHHRWWEPSRTVLSLVTHWPGCSARFQPAVWATSCRDPGVPPRCAPVMRGLKDTNRASCEGSEPCSHGAILSGEGLCSHRSKGDSLGARSINHFQCHVAGLFPRRCPPTHW
jgi:hypothetical protein